MNYRIINIAGKAHLLLHPPQLENSNCPPVRKTHKRPFLELESFPENGLYLVRSVSMRTFNFSKKNFCQIWTLSMGGQTRLKKNLEKIKISKFHKKLAQFWFYFIFFGVNIPIGHYIIAQKWFYLSRKDIYFLQKILSLCFMSHQNRQNPPCWDTIKFRLMCNLQDLYTFLCSVIKKFNSKVPERTQSEIN